ncbi:MULTISPECIES: cobyrinate a,c-diamide synthase [unclassified Adlercreutzia]|uniref:cobyrinate a,c-diamide synthase n=1 Tax=unclassified Adlercreutzia TaxID=2636013 RepID=UPI0013EE3A94|nr:MULTISPECIES: cobyrinate a,c-diamide synthase [unclassified Adlercreutzia]
MSETFNLPRIMVSASHGKSGKTVITLGILRALEKRGWAPQPFKKGPDFIDAGWHGVAAGRASRNLDAFFMDPARLRAVMCEASAGAGVAVVEGAMGLYDGMDASGSSSSAEVAKQTATPVVVVLDATRMTRTAAAITLGLICFDAEVRIAGVILNRVRGPRHERVMRESVEACCDVPVIGVVPDDERLRIADRHLGLVTCLESEAAEALCEAAAALVEESIDLDALLAIAASAPPLEAAPRCAAHVAPTATQAQASAQAEAARPLIAVVRDAAFSFYYPENLRALEQAGARLAFVDSMRDASLPEGASGLYVGGGFPEAFAAQIEANASFRASVRAFAADGGVACAECGGLMFLGRRLHADGRAYEMAGVLDFDVVMEQARQGHGYAVARATDAHPWLPAGTVLTGHEHHHSRVVAGPGAHRFAYENVRGRGVERGRDGICAGNVVASYLHVNALASPGWARGFVGAAAGARVAGR